MLVDVSPCPISNPILHNSNHHPAIIPAESLSYKTVSAFWGTLLGIAVVQQKNEWALAFICPSLGLPPSIGVFSVLFCLRRVHPR